MDPAASGEAKSAPVVLVSRRPVLAEATRTLGAPASMYLTDHANGEYTCSVQLILPMRCHPDCTRVPHAVGGIATFVIEAEEKAAECMINALRRRFGLQFNDMKWTRLNRSHCRFTMARTSLRTMVQRFSELLERSRLMEKGWEQSLADIKAARDICTNISSRSGDTLDVCEEPTPQGETLFAVHSLGAWMQERFNEGMVTLTAARGSMSS
ncbi:hypothetical protein BRADI_3g07781v3 [Brachypodium distachyon]|uniref:Uncharacterized protein n=1 Tax=Brachypodium distachyon TaxID=15368 RepID=A0A0Q3F702_BRADI|nr:hypothetical protein BRADI_3g07781v3 [Brachypodium distachyon]